MKRLFLSILLCSAVLVTSSSVLAQSSDLPDVGSYSADARAARIAALRERFQVSLTDEDRARILAGCSTAQARLKNVQNTFTLNHLTRTRDNETVIAELSTLRSMFVNSQLDSSAIDLLIVEYQQKFESYETVAAEYEVMLTDATTLECQSSPDDFQAVLEGARDTLSRVAVNAQSIKYFTDTALGNRFDILSRRVNERSE